MRKMRLGLRAMVFLFGLFLQSAIADTEVSGNIASDTTWTVAGSAYIVVGTVQVLEGATLTIEAGVTVKFDGGLSLNIGGELIARGTATDSILFTSNNATPQPGDWGSIKFVNTSIDAVLDTLGNYVSGCIIEYCRIEYGGGIECDHASPFISRNSITKNSAGNGGGICCSGCNAIITKNTISGNHAEGGGGGISCGGSPTIRDNTITGNSADYGGGILCTGWSSPIIANNTITENSSGSRGAAIYCIDRANPTINNNIISGNFATYTPSGDFTPGSKSSGHSGHGGIDCDLGSSPVISGNTITGNSGYASGGIHLQVDANATITGNTIAGNSSHLAGGIYCDSSRPIITNNIITGNFTSNNGGTIYCRSSYPALTINHNDLVNESQYEVYQGPRSLGEPDIEATNNWWGTTNTDSIDARIWDYYDDSTKGEVLYVPFLTAPINGPPYIKSVSDVSNDQGRQVRVSWHHSEYDAPGDTVTITEYCLWRRIDDPSLGLSGERSKEADIPSLLSFPPGDWDYVLTVPACGQEVYNCVAPTLCDSTSEGICWSVFFVSAMTPEPLVYFISEIDSGYSVDNLVPSTPEGLMASSGDTSINLIWNTIPEEDFRYYAIYRGRESGFTPDSSSVLGTTIDTAYSDLEVFNDSTYYYRVSAFDFAGNESGYSDEAGCEYVGIYGIREMELPKTFSLSQNYPNPFNPVTVIKYALPNDCHVKLAIFNTLGQRVATLVDGNQKAGYKTAKWDASSLSSGIYFYRLKAGGFVQTRKMVLIR